MKGKLAFWPVVLCVVLFSLTASRAVYGQAETGAIDGTVTDSTGAVIPGAKVVVRSVATGAERTASTNDRGYYNVSNLLPGLYWVLAEAPNSPFVFDSETPRRVFQPGKIMGSTIPARSSLFGFWRVTDVRLSS